jgi:hypothetical protein
MPIEVHQIVPNLFEIHWIGNITVEEVAESHEKTAQLSAAAGVERYAHVIVLSRNERVPVNVAAAAKILWSHPRLIAVFFADGKNTLKILAQATNNVVRNVEVRYFDTVESAYAQADKLLGNTASSYHRRED